MQEEKKRLILKDDTAPGGGWRIKNKGDLITALLSFPYFQTVDTGILWESVLQAVDDRQEYENTKDLAQHIADNYI